MFIDDHGDAESNYTIVALKADPNEPIIGHSLEPVGNFIADGSGIPVSSNSWCMSDITMYL